MNRSLMFIGCLIALALVCSTAGAQPTYDLVLNAPTDITRGPDVPVSFAVVGSLVPNDLTAEDPGAQGWSVSLSADNCTIVDVTIAGTAGAPSDDDPPGLEDGGFEKTELTDNTGVDPEGQPGEGDCVGRVGAVSAIVLSFTEDITLDPVAPAVILNMTVDAVTPSLPAEAEEAICEDARVFYVDGCQGAGQPVSNKVTYEGETIQPSLGEAVISLCAAPSCAEAPLNLIFQKDPVGQVPDLFAGSLGTVDEDDHVLELEAAAGSVGAGDVYAGIVSQLPGTGVQGWSLAVAVENLTMVDATIAGTVGAEAPEGMEDGGFEKTEVIDPLKEIGDPPVPQNKNGAVSAIVFSFTEDITLDPVGTATVLKLTVETIEVSPSETPGILRFEDGLVGSGQPVNNVATVEGATAKFCPPPALSVLVVEPKVAAFRTSDANADARIDIADPIFVINNLFREGPDYPCPAAADANDDQMVDLSDATYVIQYLFLAGPEPIGDLACHVDAEADCPSGSTACP